MKRFFYCSINFHDSILIYFFHFSGRRQKKFFGKFSVKFPADSKYHAKGTSIEVTVLKIS